MSTYQISQASQQDLYHIADLSSRFTTLVPFINPMPKYLNGESVDLVESRRDVALHNFATKGLTGSTELVTGSFILKSCRPSAPDLIEAFAWIQHYPADPEWHVPCQEEPGAFDVPPDCVNGGMYCRIDDAMQANRKTHMQGREHYYIRQLGFRIVVTPLETETPGKDAARSLLANISVRDPQVDKYAHFKYLRDFELFQGLGWEHTSPVVSNTRFADGGMRMTIHHGVDGWILKGVPDLDRIAVAA